MIMRFRPANISLINRRHFLPRLLLTLSSKGKKQKTKQKPPQHFEDVDRVTPYQLTSGLERAAIRPESKIQYLSRMNDDRLGKFIGTKGKLETVNPSPV
jgi:hypothetical protein